MPNYYFIRVANAVGLCSEDYVDMLYERVSVVIDQVGLSKHKQQLLAITKPCIGANYIQPNDELQATGSYVGGLPCAGNNVVWPEAMPGHPLAFVAQINLSDISKFSTAAALPTDGVLQFYFDALYNIDDRPPHGHVNEKGRWKTIYIPEEELKSEKMPFPAMTDADNIAILAPAGLQFYEAITIAADPDRLTALNFDDEEIEKFEQLLKSIYGGWSSVNLFDIQLLGYPGVKQGSMEIECAVGAAGIDLDEYFKRPDDQKAVEKFTASANEWLSLFSLDIENGPFGYWGELHIYYWIREADLKNKNFDNVWAMSQ